MWTESVQTPSVTCQVGKEACQVPVGLVCEAPIATWLCSRVSDATVPRSEMTFSLSTAIAAVT